MIDHNALADEELNLAYQGAQAHIQECGHSNRRSAAAPGIGRVYPRPL
jgi:hypothetical protein